MVKAGIAALALTTAGLFIASRRLALVTVAGRSMEPALADGDRLLAWRRPRRPLRLGDVVVLEAPYPAGVLVREADDGSPVPPPWQTPPAGPREMSRRWIVKRVAAQPGDAVPASAAGRVPAGTVVPPGRLLVVGDNPGQSYDSRQVGFVPAERVLGLVIRRLG
ncbi:S26 family signal peptidase [Kribbella sp. NBC_01245]|uniref:S26 family signal peptidase n=1 Tax=Kribbella sp. NBC_01245 TaxID=2903578 RepID=UPI002E2E1F48|nr:S26 family signal peptidase [Kribbella sp. NBC_01245]